MSKFSKLISHRIIQIIFLVIGIFCISLLAIQPFTLNQMPETADGILHLFRVAVTDYSLQVDNPLWLRYSTGIVYGYGAPLFNYFPPLSYYLGSWLHTLGLTFVQSWLMMMVIYTMLSGFGMFLLGRIWTQSNVGGWVTAIAFIYAPYYLFDSIARGTSSELGALAILPFALYGFTRLAFYGRRVDFWFAVIAFALFIPMHTLITLHGTALMAIYCLFLWITSEDKKRTFVRLLLAGGIAFLLTAFFWMPAILETSAVKINLIAENLDQIDVTQHLRSLSEILALPHTADPTQQNQAIPITLSWVQIIISGFGLVIAMNDRNRRYHHLLLVMGIIVAILVFLNTPASEWIWVNVPLIAYTQFPWRILGLASLVLSLMTGVSIWLTWSTLPSGWRNLAVFSVLTLIIAVYSIPWTYSLYLGDIELNDIRDVHTFERETGQLTVSSYSEYLPVSTDESQLDPNHLIERFEENEIIPRLLENETLKIISEEWTSTSGKLRLQSSESQSLKFDWLYVDGWVASLDADNIEVYPSLPEGLVTVDIPAGDFDLSISLQPTSTQSASVVISFLGLIAVGLVSLFWRYISGFSNLHNLAPDPEISIYAIVIAIGISIFLFKAVILDHSNSSFMSKRFGELSSENAQISPLANFGNQIDLVDTEVGIIDYNTRILSIKLYWKLHDTPIDIDYSAIIRMLNPEGIVIAEQNEFLLGGIATQNWLQHTYVEHVINFEIPKYTPPLADGLSYTFEVSLFKTNTLESISVMNTLGNPEDSKFLFNSHTLNVGGQRLFNYQELIGVNYVSDVVGLYLPAPPNFPSSASVGEEIIFDWTWQKVKQSWKDHSATIQWINSSNQVLAESDTILLVNGFETNKWQAGEVFTAHHRLIVPADLAGGDYQIGIQLLSQDGEYVGEPVNLNSVIQITEPDRILEQPEFIFDDPVDWSNTIQLLGYNLEAQYDLELIWQTDNILDTSLHLFVQVIDNDDLIVAQSDGIPVDWTRPTTSWIPDEFVTTIHNFDNLSTDEYRVRVGWYNPITGDRVGVEESDSYILDEMLTIE